MKTLQQMELKPYLGVFYVVQPENGSSLFYSSWEFLSCIP